MKISKLLVANRGEIAVRVMRTARKLGIRTVAVYSEIDKESIHVKMADEACCIGHSLLSDTYLNISKMVSVALEFNCDAIHPGYGFLAENPEFVEACQKAGKLFVGPDTRAMKIMGNKIEARKFVEAIGIPITKGLTGKPDYLLSHADEVGFPLLVKAAAGGGGKGMRIVRSGGELEEALESTSREAASYFADGTVYIEKFVENPRHIEVQLLGDQHGNVIHLFERECSIQRRYQKIIEEAPSPTVTPDVRQKMGDAATAIGKAIEYSSAGTIEFLVDENLDFYFLEMNTRIQVEHPVTEMTTGIDIVEEQLRIASGDTLRIRQEDLRQKGHAIECRIYAEDPENGFLPSPGEMSLYAEPHGDSIRIDSGISGKQEIQGFFDPMISKLIVYGDDRDTALHRMAEALQQYVVHGIRNNISYLLAVIRHPAYIQNQISTRYCDLHSVELLAHIEESRLHIDPKVIVIAALIGSMKRGESPTYSVWGQIGYWRNYMQPIVQIHNTSIPVHLFTYSENQLEGSMDNSNFRVGFHVVEGGKVELDFEGKHAICWISSPFQGRVIVSHQGSTFETTRVDMLPQQVEFSNSEQHSGNEDGNIVSPMPGRVIKISVAEGDPVQKGDLLLVVEAMKMENAILSPGAGVVDRISVSVGDLVDGSTRLVHLK